MSEGTGPRLETSAADAGGGDASRIGVTAAWLTTGSAAVLLGMKIYARAGAAALFDDAFMFQRYAANLLRGRGLRWNVGGEPTFGVTSLATLLLAVPSRLIAGARNPAFAAFLTSFVPGLAFVGLTGGLILKTPSVARPARLAVLMTTMTMLALGHGVTHFVSGMDTMLGLAYLAAYLFFASKLDQAPNRRRSMLLGGFGGLCLAVRPEVGLFTTLLPLAQCFGAPTETRRANRMTMAVTLGMLLGFLGVARGYFGTALPLSFYAKSLRLYGPTIVQRYRGRTTQELVTFVADYWPLVALIAVDLGGGLRRYLRNTTKLERVTLIVTLLFLAYEWLFVLPIMFYDQRFYHLAVPALVFLATRAAGRLEQAWGPRTAAWPAATAVVFGFALAAPFASAGTEVVNLAKAENPPARFALLPFAASTGVQKNLFRPDAFAALPADAVIASSEVGLLGVLAPNTPIVDLAGLNERTLVTSNMSAARVFDNGGPDVLYFPHGDYREFIAAILSVPEIRGYDLYPPRSLGTVIGLGIKRSSRYYERMKDLVEGHDPVEADRYDPSMNVRGR